MVFADGPIAVDTEAMGLLPRPRPAVPGPAGRRQEATSISCAFGQGSNYSAPNLKALLGRPQAIEIVSFRALRRGPLCAPYLGIMASPLYCTRTASRLVRTYTDRHGLKDLVKELLCTEISKQQQTSDWGAPELSDAQRDYAASDVRYLHRAQGEARRPPAARRPRRRWPRPASTSCPTRAAARPRRLARDGHLRAQLMSEAANLQRERASSSWAEPGSRHDKLVGYAQDRAAGGGRACVAAIFLMLAARPKGRKSASSSTRRRSDSAAGADEDRGRALHRHRQ